MDCILDKLFSIKEDEYRDFTIKLNPNVDPKRILGIRVPILRELAKSIDIETASKFKKELPHQYFEENMLHGFLIEKDKDIKSALTSLDSFLKYVDNWAVCDSTNPKLLGKHKDLVLSYIKKWLKEEKEVFKVRYAINCLMRFYLKEDFKEEYLLLVGNIKSNEYYINMVQAWFFAESLIKQYDAAIKYIKNPILDKWTHNKAIQKAKESYRISEERKQYLTSLKIKKS